VRKLTAISSTAALIIACCAMSWSQNAGSSKIRGHIEYSESTKSLVARLYSQKTSSGRTDEQSQDDSRHVKISYIDRDGYFEFTGLLQGSYLLEIYSGNRLLYQKVVSTQQSQPLEIPLDTANLPEAIKGLHFTIDDSPSGRQQLASQLTNAYGRRVVAKTRLIQFKYDGSEDMPPERRTKDLDLWQKGITAILVDAGFREPSPKEFEGMAVNPQNMGQYLDRRWMGARGSTSHLSPHVGFVMDDRYDECLSVGEVLVILPEQQVETDYGTIGIVLMGLGNCKRTLMPNEALSDEMLEMATQYLHDQIDNQ
jgi:hypothetical protein